MAEENSFVYGIIHIGSSSLSMRIVEYKDADTIRVIEEVRKETTFGEEVFINKKLSFTSIRRLCDMLNGLKQLLRDYCVTDYKVYATAILREAENRRPVLDLIHVNTGFHVDVVDMPQEIYYKHYLLQYLIQKSRNGKRYDYGDNLLFVDITSGCVGLTAWENGSLRYQHNVHIGTLRLLETFKQNQRDSLDFPQAMAEYIHAIMSPLWGAIKRYHPSSIILSGREARIIASLMRLSMDAENKAEVKADAFKKLYMEAGSLSASRTRQKYYVSEQWAMTVLPTIHIYKEILDNVPVEHILMFGTTFVEAVTMFYGAEKVKEPFILYMQTQNIELTRSIAAAYYYEPLHTKALELYSHVNLLDSQAHAWNLIRGTDIFGISDKEKDIVASVVYYDHKGNPSDDDTPFRILSDTAKMTALKLISIFRMVRAMDISRKQKMKDITARATGDILIIEYDSRENTALETWMFDKNKEFFENVYGLEVKLERR